MKDNVNKEIRHKGLALSGGCVSGRVCMFNENRHSNLPQYKVEGSGHDLEVSRVKSAIEIGKQQLEEIRGKVEVELGKAEAEIFVAHSMILDDSSLIKEIDEHIRMENLNAESAVIHVLDTYEARLQALDDEYIKARATDFGEIRRRLLDIMGHMRPALQCDEAHCQKGRNRIIVADELTPSLTIEIDPKSTLGFVTERGGVNSHAAILARAMGIPAITVQGVRDMVGCGTDLLVDGDTGELVICPSEETMSSARAAGRLDVTKVEVVEPVDGFKVMANINLAEDIEEALLMQAEGAGLYRTEFEVIAAGRLFSEDELYKRYVSVGRAMAGKGVIYRLFDVGSDKALSFMEVPHEENPSLGWRGARLLLGNREMLSTQARALARTSAGPGGRIHVMYPMIIDLDQFLEIKEVFMKSIEGVDHGEILHGIMFEVPSACLQAAELYEHIDFASIGTNDLTQYFFAVDRDNDLVSYDYNPDRDVFWKLLKTIADAANAAGKPLSVCGELAGFPRFVPKLIDVGISAVSVSPRRITAVRQAAESLLNE